MQWNMVDVLGSRTYIPVREQPLDVCSLMQSNLSSEEEKNIERVHQWIAQQQKFAGMPPPDEEQTLIRSQSSTDVTGKDVSSSISDSTAFTEWIHRSDDDMLKFSGLEVNRYYSPNMTRRRGYAPGFECSLPWQQISSDITCPITCPNGNELHAVQHNDECRETTVPTSPTQSPVTCSPLSKYFCRSGEGNTFPRRNKLNNRDDRRNLFSSAIVENQVNDKPRVSSNQNRVEISNRCNDKITTNQYDGSMSVSYNGVGQSASNDDQAEDRAVFLSSPRSFVPQDVNRELADKNNNLISTMSLDTQRLLSGNLPDVALTAAKAIHKRELSDSLPKYKVRTTKDSSPNHVRVSSAPETTYVNSGVEQKKHNNNNQTCEVQKVKAFSWPKRAILPSYKDFMKEGHVKKNPRMKTESGYNTEKSEEKNDVIVDDNDEFTETVDTELPPGVESDHTDSPRSSCADSIHSNDSNSIQSSCTESVHSDQSDPPPARPPLPAPKTFLKDAHALASSKNVELFKKDLHLSSEVSNVFSQGSYLKSSHNERLSTMGSLPGKAGDGYYHSMRYLRSKECIGSTRVSSFCPSAAELTRNVSMSLKDLIRIHEQEIARVSGAGSTNCFKSTDPMLVNRRKNSACDLKMRSKCAWKRHTTIGLLTHFDVNGAHAHDDALDYLSENVQNQTYPDSKGSSCSEKSSVIFCQAIQPETTSPPFSPPDYCDRKKNGPHVLPKPSKSLLCPLTVDTSERRESRETFERYKTAEKGTQAHVIITRPLCKDVSIQTDLVLVDLYRRDVKEVDKTQLEMKFEKEKQIMHRKLEEQKKVANAYQKLEDRYRRKVYELQKALHMCTCSRDNVPVKLYTGDMSNSGSSNLPVVNEDKSHDISVQKVDGILNQLEAWLNKQTNGLHTDRSELSSLIESTTTTSKDTSYPRNFIESTTTTSKDTSYPRNFIESTTTTRNDTAYPRNFIESTTTASKDTSYPRNFKRLPLDIIDQIDATSV